MPKDSLKDKLDENELDLSLNNLEVVPVKELAALTRATHLDLSCNLLTALPDSFCTLTHLVKVDLSKNRLTELPQDFGQLDNLQHLDLLGNQLTTLPESFHKLHKLKWLDLKDNPLEPLLKKNAGDCLDEKQCRDCAKRILLYMEEYSAEMEKRREKALKAKREKEAELQAAEEAEARRKREAKKAEKEKRKREAQEKNAQKRKISGGSKEVQKPEDETRQAVKKSVKDKTGQGFCSCCIMLFSIFALLVALVVGVAFHCTVNLEDKLCRDYYKPVERQVYAVTTEARGRAVHYFGEASGMTKEAYASASAKAAELYESARKYLGGASTDSGKNGSNSGQAGKT